MKYLNVVTREELQAGDQFVANGVRMHISWIYDEPDEFDIVWAGFIFVMRPGPAATHSIKRGETFQLVEPIEFAIDREPDQLAKWL